MVKHFFIPGSEWVYFKIYVNSENSDYILKNVILKYLVELKNNELIKEFFFIRYLDTDYHIRLRIKLKNNKDFSSIYNLFYKYFYKISYRGLIWNIQCGTYKREIERYGDRTIDLVEKLFFYDSEIILKFIHSYKNLDEERRFLFAVSLIDFYFSLFKYNTNEKISIAHTLSETLIIEFNLSNPLFYKNLNKKFKLLKDKVYSMFACQVFLPFFEEKEAVLSRVVEEIAKKIKYNKDVIKTEVMFSNVVHMSLNRLFSNNNRLYEMLAYYILGKYYEYIGYRK